jgi:hypothetical protein
MKILCGGCKIPMAMQREGIFVVSDGEVRAADEYWCKGCGTVVWAGFASSPLGREYLQAVQSKAPHRLRNTNRRDA